MIDVIARWDTRKAYTHIAAVVARELCRRTGFGGGINLSERVLSDYVDIFAVTRKEGKQLFAFVEPPLWGIGALARTYRSEKDTSIYLSPASTNMRAEDVEEAVAFGTIFVPSQWSKFAVEEAFREVKVTCPQIRTLKLGVPVVYAEGRDRVYALRQSRRDRGQPYRVCHFTGDFDRKGTDVLLRAWPKVKEAYGNVCLTVHTIDMMDTLYQFAASLDLLEPSVSIVTPLEPGIGALPHELFEIMAHNDLVVCPSRGEGFGLLGFAALVAGVPLCTTAASGEEYLSQWPDCWTSIATVGMGQCGFYAEPGLMAVVETAAVEVAIIEALSNLEKMETAQQQHAAKAWRHVWGGDEAMENI